MSTSHDWVAVGIDPGASGGVAFVSSWGRAEAWEIDTKRIDHLEEVFAEIPKCNQFLAGVEEVHGRGGWGANTNFSLGGAYWVPRAFLEWKTLPCVSVRPLDWQAPIRAVYSVPEVYEARKRRFIELARKEWDFVSLTSGMADALWIARLVATRYFGLSPHL